MDKFGSENVKVATTYYDLALICEALGDFDQAKEYQECFLALLLDTLGPENLILSAPYHNLASIYHDLGDFEQAKKYDKFALTIQLDKPGLYSSRLR